MPPGDNIVYSLATIVPQLDEPTQSIVRKAYADSLRVMWLMLLGVDILALICALCVRDIPLHRETDPQWDLDRPTDSDAIAEGEKEDK